MVVAANALLYVFALALAFAVISPLPDDASRGVRAARATLVCAGGAIVALAVVLAILGHWYESALAGTASIVIVGVCMWLGLSRMPSQSEDDEDEDDDGGGSNRGTDPPEPTQPAGDGPSDDLWADFDAARADWERDRDQEPLVL